MKREIRQNVGAIKKNSTHLFEEERRSTKQRNVHSSTRNFLLPFCTFLLHFSAIKSRGQNCSFSCEVCASLFSGPNSDCVSKSRFRIGIWLPLPCSFPQPCSSQWEASLLAQAQGDSTSKGRKRRPSCVQKPLPPKLLPPIRGKEVERKVESSNEPRLSIAQVGLPK